MRCEEARKLFSADLDGELSAAQTARLEAHLAACRRCDRERRLLQETTRLVARLGSERCPVDLRDSVMRAVSAPSRPLGGPVSLPRLARAAFTLACGATLVAAAGYVATNGAGKPSLAVAPRRPIPGERVVDRALHAQYDLSNALGLADGLLLSMPEPAAGPDGAGTSERPPAPAAPRRARPRR